MPESWLQVLRNNPLLFSLNRYWLHRYDLWVKPETAADQTKAYQGYIAKVEQTSKAESVSVPLTLLVLVPQFVPRELERTLKAAEGGFSRVLLWCNDGSRTACEAWMADYDASTFESLHCGVNEAELIAHQIAGEPWFVLYQGDVPAQCAGQRLLPFASGSADVGYTDVDTLNESDERQTPAFLPDWNPDLQLSTAYVASGLWLRRPEQLLAMDPQLLLRPEGLAAWLVQRFLQEGGMAVAHLPQVLVHRSHKHALSMTDWQMAVSELLGDRASVVLGEGGGCLSVVWQHDVQPLVSLIIPTYNGKELVQTCIESILHRSTYHNVEILLVDNNSDEPESLAYFEEIAGHPKIRVLRYPHPFNYSAINNFAAREARGDLLGLINNDIEVIAPDWLDQMVAHAMRDDIGCVGAKLLYPDGRIQHAGVIMGYGGGAGHAHKHFPSDHPGYLKRLIASHNFSAVTAACLLIKRHHFERVGGFNEQKFAVAFNDVDLCLRVRALGVRNLYCAEALLYHHESVSRGHEDTPEKMARFAAEVAHLQRDWKAVIEHDPAYNPNLTLRSENFILREPVETARISSVNE